MAECLMCANGLVSPLTTPEGSCPAVGFQKASVCVPVTVAPFARTGTTITKCCGDPLVVEGDMSCPGKKNGVCSFTISQVICVEVPVSFGATATVGDTFVECLEASDKDICRNCKREEE